MNRQSISRATLLLRNCRKSRNLWGAMKASFVTCPCLSLVCGSGWPVFHRVWRGVSSRLFSHLRPVGSPGRCGTRGATQHHVWMAQSVGADPEPPLMERALDPADPGVSPRHNMNCRGRAPGCWQDVSAENQSHIEARHFARQERHQVRLGPADRRFWFRLRPIRL